MERCDHSAQRVRARPNDPPCGRTRRSDPAAAHRSRRHERRPPGRRHAAVHRALRPRSPAGDELVAACGHGGDLDILRSLAGPPAPGTTDPRISRLVDDVRADPSRAFRAHETASRLGLSTSHFLRLFAQHTGTTFRRYQQWARLLHAVRGMVAGHDLTRCATDAGFASPSHFSDTFHRTFGLSPSALLSSRIQIDLDAIEP